MTVDPQDPHDVQRFVAAQERTYRHALAEIRSGRKRTHWMWFIFPQLAGLGSSPTSEFYAIRSRDEGTAYLAHRTLGPRLRECSAALLSIPERSASDIFGFPDDQKLRSCMTLFATVSAPGSIFEQVLDRYFDGERDERTMQLLSDTSRA